jgi:hypothetical protein
MTIPDILHDKLIKPKDKTETIAKMLTDAILTVEELIGFASEARDADKATCIEALEYVSQKLPEIVNADAFGFVARSLAEKAPRVKWESARVIGNTAHLFAGNLDTAIRNLLANTEHPGTVVRWSAAFALAQVIKLGLPANKDLLPAIEAIVNREDKNSIRKIYLEAFKKAKK